MSVKLASNNARGNKQRQSFPQSSNVQGGGGMPPQSKVIRKSQATDVATLIESQNSIFDQLEKINSFSMSREPGMSNLNNQAMPQSQNQNQNMSGHPPHIQPTDESGAVGKYRTFRDILESIDEQEMDIRKYNQLQALREEEENHEDDMDGGGQTDQQLKESVQQKLLYDKFCIKNVKNSSNLRATQNSSDAVKLGESSQGTRPSMRPSALAVFGQQSEGVLNRSLKQPQMSTLVTDQGMVVQPRDSELNNKNDTAASLQNQQQKKHQLTVMVQDSGAVLSQPGQQSPNSDLGSLPPKVTLNNEEKALPQIKQQMTTEQGIVKRVMPDKIKTGMVLDQLGLEMQAHSLDPDRFEHEALGSIIRGEVNNIMVMKTHRAPDLGAERVPPLTDEMNTNLKNFDTSQMSMNINSTFRQELNATEEGEQQPNCYLVLPWEDINLIIESINEDNEQMKIYFGCKGLKSILLVSPLKLVLQLVKRYSNRLLRRLVLLLGYEHLPDTMAEALHIIALLTNLMDQDVISEMVVAGLVHQLNKFIDTKFMQTRSNKMSAELALQIMANVTQISNLSINHMQMVYIPDVQTEDEATIPGLNFFDRMISLCQLTEATITMDAHTVTSQSPRSPILFSEEDQKRAGAAYVSQSMGSYSVQIGPNQLADLRIQLGYIAKQIVSRSRKEMKPENMDKIVTLLLELINQSISVGTGHSTVANPGEVAMKHMIIWKSTMVALRMLCGTREQACSVLQQNESSIEFAKSLGTIAEVCTRDSEVLPLLMDTLVVIGDLTASESFSEETLFVQNDLFKILKSVLNSKIIAKIEPEFSSVTEKSLTKLKFEETVAWTVANAVADNENCRLALIEKHYDLIVACFSLAEAKSEKIDIEICYMIENLLQSRKTMKKHLFSQNVAEKKDVIEQSISSYKESDRAPTADGLRKRKSRSRRRDYTPDVPHEKFVDVLNVLTMIIKDRPIQGIHGTDDQLDYQVISCVMKLFKLDSSKVQAHVIGKKGQEEIGLPALVEGIYKMEHHWSGRVYEKAVTMTNKYLVGKQGAELHNMTNIYSELCQETLIEPDPKVVERTVAELNLKAKSRGVTSRRRQDEESDPETENSAEEEARDRAKTFLMTLAQKRAYEMQKKAEKEFNSRFKVTFITVVSYYMIMQARIMKVIDMTNTEALKRQTMGTPIKFSPKKSRKGSASKHKSSHREVKVSQLDLDLIADERAIIPKPLLAYHKHLIVHTQRINERQRRQEMREEMLRVAQNAILAKQIEKENLLSNVSQSMMSNRRLNTDAHYDGLGSRLGQGGANGPMASKSILVKENRHASTASAQSKKNDSSRRPKLSGTKLAVQKRPTNLTQGRKVSSHAVGSSTYTDGRSKSRGSSNQVTPHAGGPTRKNASSSSKRKK